MQGNLGLRRGRGRGYFPGHRDLTHTQTAVPAIPPFPFHHQQFFDSGYPPVASQSSVSRGRGLSVHDTRGPCNGVPLGLCSRGSRGLSSHKPRGVSLSVSRGVSQNVGNAGPCFSEPKRDRQRGPRTENQRHFIPSLPEPRPNTLTQEEWYALNHNGRPLHGSVCAVVCCCTFGEGYGMRRIFSFCCGEKSPEEHTEKKVLQQIIMLENGAGRELRNVVLISSRSPCVTCAEDMITFVKSRGFSMNLYFTALEKKIGRGRCGIRMLTSFGIPMRVADNYIWSYLASLLAVCEGKPQTTFSDGSEVDTVDRSAWDDVWSQQLEAVVSRDLRHVLDCRSLCDKFNDVRRVMIEREAKDKENLGSLTLAPRTSS